MHLSAPQVRQVLTGHKTQHRLTSTAGAPAARFTVGRSYSLRTHNPSEAQRDLKCRILVENVEPQTLGAITFKDALAEGHKTTDMFRVWWVRQHDRKWSDAHADDQDALARFEARHSPRDVWVLSFKVDPTARPRLLMPIGRRGGDELGYTENSAKALRDEPEAIEESLQKWYSEDARERFTGQPGRREHALNQEAHNLGRQLKQEIRSIPYSLEVTERLARIQSEIDALRRLREAA